MTAPEEQQGNGAAAAEQQQDAEAQQPQDGEQVIATCCWGWEISSGSGDGSQPTLSFVLFGAMPNAAIRAVNRRQPPPAVLLSTRCRRFHRTTGQHCCMPCCGSILPHSAQPCTQVITPWDVTGGSDGKIDYNKLVAQVGAGSFFAAFLAASQLTRWVLARRG